MISWFANIRNKPAHLRQQIVFWIALAITVCIFLVWGIAKFRILSHKVEESRSDNVEKPASPFAVFGKSLKNIFKETDVPPEENMEAEFVPAETQIESSLYTPEMQLEEDLQSMYYVPTESLDIPEDSIDFRGENE